MTTPALQPDLIAWLRQQLDIDEDEANAYLADDFANVLGRELAERILAQAEANRRILDAHATAASAEDSEYDGGLSVGLLTAIRFLACPYADRPGYRDEWRPA